MNIEHAININVKNSPTQANVPMSFGCPFPKGLLTSLSQLQLCQIDVNGNSHNIPFTASKLNHWSDSSYKWLNIAFVLDTKITKLVLNILNKSISAEVIPHKGLIFTQENQHATIKNNNQTYHISLNRPGLPRVQEAQTEEKTQRQGLYLVDENDTICPAIGEEHTLDECKNPHSSQLLRLALTISGRFESSNPKISALRFTLCSTFHEDSPFVECQLQVHNIEAAEHPSGQWDLGDSRSVKIKGIKLPYAINNLLSVSIKGLSHPPLDINLNPWTLTQYSSGGDNWQSLNHVDETNKVPLLHKGAHLDVTGHPTERFLRPCPSFTFLKADGGQNIHLAMENFWQTFPNQVSGTDNKVEFDFLTAQTGTVHELQGGEKICKTVWVVNDTTKDSNLEWVFNKPVIYLDQEWYEKCCVIDNTSLNLGSSHEIGSLIRLGLEGRNHFFSKREHIDEYGWRNFGDLFADHETAAYKGNDLFISHYNNQYDPLYGFIRCYLQTGESAWYTLANDLAQHVKNIDIYHTTNDKPEYNGGLFWHTDHYVKACTSSHRSYSRLQENGVYQDHAGGGGPGGQHCYTTGLTYHYLLTGELSSKQAVLTLTEWIRHVYDGTGTLFELLLGIKNRHVPGLKNQISGQYPFDRGTANLIVALLDSFELTQENQYLAHVEHVIRNTVHPADSIKERHLDNVELSWFYTVFLQAVSRYLDVKRKQAVFDDDFYYARDVLLHYANWMLENERPYLENPDILEFPNDTWTAQDLRKTAVLAAAWYYSNAKNAALLEKAKYYQHYVAKKLAVSKEQSYTRVLALLMQNSGSLEYYMQAETLSMLNLAKQDWPLAPYMKTGFLTGILKQFFKRVTSFSIQNEYHWLKKRLGK